MTELVPAVLAALAAVAVVRLCRVRPWPRRLPGEDRPAGRDDRPPERPSGSAPSARHRHRGWVLTGGRRRHPSAGDVPPDLVRCIDLLGVSATAGLGIRDAVRAVAALGTGPAGSELAQVVGEANRGSALGDALDRAADRDASLRPLVATLAVTMSSGAPAAPALQRLADAERRRSRRRTEARVRRLPVLLTVPLVVCILPAFVILTLVPIGIAAVDRLPAGPVPARVVGPVTTRALVPVPSIEPPRSPP